MQSKLSVLFVVPPKGPSQTQTLLSKIEETTSKYIQTSTFVKDIEEYNALSEDLRKSFDVLVL